jgi:hypothetical protein
MGRRFKQKSVLVQEAVIAGIGHERLYLAGLACGWRIPIHPAI